jgi:hypothetical protein
MEMDLAVRLGELLVEVNTIDKQLKALGHRLVGLDADFEADCMPEDRMVSAYQPTSKVYGSGSTYSSPRN